jgi:hypothetical protein
MVYTTEDIIGYTIVGVFWLLIALVLGTIIIRALLAVLRRRRWRSRARRGLCIHCKQSLDGVESNQCPECGKDGRMSSPANRAAAYEPYFTRSKGG